MWKFCLSWGVPWDTFWALSAEEESALFEAATQIDRERKNARKRKG